MAEVRRISGGHPTHFGIRLEFTLPDATRGLYAFKIGALAGGNYEVQSEKCAIGEPGQGPSFELERGQFKSHSEDSFPAVAADRLALVSASGLKAFRPVYDALTAMGLYNISPKLIRDLQKPQDGKLLRPTGENIASVIAHLERTSPQALLLIERSPRIQQRSSAWNSDNTIYLPIWPHMTIVPVVEGHREVPAVPVLLRRLAQWITPEMAATIAVPIRVSRDKFLNKEEEFHRILLLAGSKCGDSGWVMALLDADDDGPVDLARRARERAWSIIPHQPVSVVVPKREFEAWCLACASSLNNVRGLAVTELPHAYAEDVRGAKEWLGKRMPGGYGETADQAAFCARMDLPMALANSRSFRKLHDDWLRFSRPRAGA